MGDLVLLVMMGMATTYRVLRVGTELHVSHMMLHLIFPRAPRGRSSMHYLHASSHSIFPTAL